MNFALPWRPHTERPAALPVTALIAVLDEADGEPLLMSGGIYTMTERTGGVWVDEDTFAPLVAEEFWWLTEEDLLREVR